MKGIRAFCATLVLAVVLAIGAPGSLAEQNGIAGLQDTSGRPKMTDDILVGDWKDTPGGDVGNFYCFYSDGGFRYAFSNAWDALDPRVYTEGTWKLENNAITISISSLVTQENGVLQYDTATGYKFEGGNLVTYPLGTDLVKEYTLGSLYEEKTEGDEYYGRPFKSMWTVVISRPFESFQLWKYSDIPSPRNEAEEAAYDEALNLTAEDW